MPAVLPRLAEDWFRGKDHDHDHQKSSGAEDNTRGGYLKNANLIALTGAYMPKARS
jgi:hypothetical protein